MKNNIKKLITWSLITVMVFSLAGCKDSEIGKEKKDSKEMVYVEEDLKLGGFEGKIASFTVENDKIYFLTSAWIEESKAEGDEKGEGRKSVKLYSVQLDGSDLEEIPSVELKQNEDINGIAVTDKKEIVLLKTFSYKDKTEYTLYKLSEDGTVLLEENVTELLKQKAKDVLVSKMMTDKKGRIILAAEQAFYVFDKNVKSVEEIKTDFVIEGIAKTKDSEIVCGSNGEEGAFVQIYNVDSKEWSEQIPLDISSLYVDSLIDGREYDFYYTDKEGVFGCNVSTKKATPLINGDASNVLLSNVSGLVPITKDRLIALADDGENAKFTFFVKVNATDVKDKKTITYGTTCLDETAQKAVNEFNKKNKEYKIEIKDYSEEEEPEQKMATDMIAGNVPDIIDLTYLSPNQYGSKGLLEDLTPYFEKDEEIALDDLLPSVAAVMKTGDKMYYVSPGFSVSTVVGKTEDIGEKDGWTFEEMKALLEKKGNGVRLFGSEYKTDILSHFSYMFQDFVDWENGKCSFDSQDFREVLELCNRGKNDDGEYNGDEENKMKLVREGKVLFTDGTLSTEKMQVYEQMFGTDISFIGYPNKDKSGSYFSFQTRLGMYSKSENKEAVWEFLRTFMTKEYQAELDSIVEYPTRQDNFDMVMKEKTATESYTDELGRRIEPIQGGTEYEDMMVEYKPLSKEGEKAFRKLVDTTKKSTDFNDKIESIILEEVNPYFMGEKSLDETIEIIQNRVQTLVNESM